MEGGEKVKVSIDQIQQHIKGVETKQKGFFEEQDIDFQGIMFQIISMMNMKVIGSQDNESILSQNTNMQDLDITNHQQDILLDALSNLHIEDFKNDQNSHELVDLVDKMISGQNIQLSEDGVIKLQNNDELNNVLEKIDLPLEKLLMELKDTITPQREGEEVKSIDISRNNRIIATFQEKVEDDQKSIMLNTNNESILGKVSKDIKRTLLEKPIFTKEILTEKKSTNEISTKSNFGLSLFETIDQTSKSKQQVEIQNIHEIAKEMIKEIKILKNGEQSNLHLKLRPKELGEIEIKLAMKAGEVVGRILVESLAIKGAIENQIQHLKEQLGNQNILIQEIDVDLQQHSGENYQDNSFLWNGDTSSSNYMEQDFIESKETEREKDLQQPLGVNSYYSRGQASSLNLLA